MKKRIFIDTNILVYAYDPSDPWKRSRAIEILDKAITAKIALVSPQVLAEFVSVITSKIPQPLTIEEAYDSVENYL